MTICSYILSELGEGINHKIYDKQTSGKETWYGNKNVVMGG